MHLTKARQLLAHIAALALAAAACAEDRAPNAGLAAARDRETALRLRSASGAEWRELGGTFAALAEKNPGDCSVRNGYGEFLWSRDERERAAAEWRAAEKIEPANVIVLNHLGEAQLAASDPRGAMHYFQRATVAAPADALSHFNLANLVFIFRRDVTASDDAGFALALTHFAEASRLAPKNAEFARAYAETFYSMPTPDWPTAIGAWRHFMEISPRKDFAWANLARIHLNLRQKPEAMGCLKMIDGKEFDRLKERLTIRIRALPDPGPAVTSPKPGIDDDSPAP